ncbi:MAG TPA: alkaline phosphatase family protein [Thermoanaerobaculaceae bacterium]|nr:alkaline phosphatase family protein [Thermoanaerobaculaceae bacterium]HPS76916.1 alkaline phosphatase family protein [Thermoanaerobaculaceae bacterium]
MAGCPRRLLQTAIGGVLVMCGVTEASGAPASGAAPRPRIAVLVVAQGLGAAQLELYRPWYASGLKRLLEEGWNEPNCRFRHFLTQDAPGNASVATGVTPHRHGIVADRWLETRPDGRVAWTGAAEQPWAPAPGAPPLFYREVKAGDDLLVFAIEFQLKQWEADRTLPAGLIPIETAPKGGKGRVFADSRDAAYLYALRHGQPVVGLPTAPMAGAAHLEVTTIADELARQQPASRVFVIGGDAESAVLLAGKTRSHSVYWFDPQSGQFSTSGAYDLSSLSSELVRKAITEFNEHQAGRALAVRFGAGWRRLPLAEGLGPRENLPAATSGIADFQIPVLGLGFDHDLTRHPAGIFGGIAASPLVDELVVELAVALVERPDLKLGAGQAPDLLVLSLPSFDAVAHAYGPESEEALEVIRRLDRSLGTLLGGLEPVAGKDAVVLALTSNHGFSPIPEVEALRDPELTGGRLVWGKRALVDFVTRLNRAIASELCLEPYSRPILDAVGWGLVLNRRPLQSGLPCHEPRPVAAAELEDAIAKSLRTFDAEEVDCPLFTSREASWPAQDSLVAFARSSLFQGRSPDAFLLLKPGVIVSGDPGRGGGHGGVHDADLHVPLILWGGGVPAGSSNGVSTPYDVAPTLAVPLGVALADREGHDIFVPPRRPEPPR